MVLDAATASLSTTGWYRLPELAAFAEVLRGGPVTDLVLNADGRLWVDQGAGMRLARPWHPPTPAQARSLAVRLIGRGGRHLDDATPVVDVRLAGGVRVHAVLPPLSPDGVLLSIRLPAHEPYDLDRLAREGMFSGADGAGDDALLRTLRAAVQQRTNLLVTGATGSGKTTLLAALLAECAPEERLLVLEDVAELRIQHPHVVGLQVRQPNLEGAGGVPLSRLIRESLRMRPDRLVLGECRGAELAELCAALNTGHAGSAGTMHVNSLDDLPARIEALGALAGLGTEAVARQAVSAFGLIVYLERRAGRRYVAGLGRLVLAAGRLEVHRVEPA